MGIHWGTQEEWEELGTQYKELLELFVEMLPKLGLLLLIVLLLALFFIWRYQRSKRKLLRDLSKIDMDEMLPYFRELPGSYSPSIVSVLQDHEEEIKKDIPAELLNLCSKQYLTIEKENGKMGCYVFRGTGKDDFCLPQHERYVLHWILGIGSEFDFSRGFDVMVYRKMVIQEAQRLNLLQLNKGYQKNSTRKIKTHQIIAFIMAFLVVMAGRYIYRVEKPMLQTPTGILPIDILANLVEYIMPILIIFLIIQTIIMLFMTIPRLAGYEFSSRSRLKRTQHGNNEYRKWLAFKSFLIDFSLIRERHAIEVTIWEFYLAYAVALGIADQVEGTENAQMLQNKTFNLTNYASFKSYVESLDSFTALKKM